MQHENKALRANETWAIEDLPPEKESLGCQWIYKIKYNYSMKVERLKAQSVIFGNHQTKGIDYRENFSTAAKVVTI